MKHTFKFIHKGFLEDGSAVHNSGPICRHFNQEINLSTSISGNAAVMAAQLCFNKNEKYKDTGGIYNDKCG